MVKSQSLPALYSTYVATTQYRVFFSPNFCYTRRKSTDLGSTASSAQNRKDRVNTCSTIGIVRYVLSLSPSRVQYVV